MKVLLMYRVRDFDPKAALPPNADALTQDLELDTLCKAMAQDDAFLLDIAKKALLLSLDNPEAIAYRQHALNDVVGHSEVVRRIYTLAVEAIEQRKKIWGWHFDYPDSVLRSSVETLDLFFDILKRLRRIADAHGRQFRSEAFVRLFGMIEKELDDAYLLKIQEHLQELRFPEGERMSAGLGKGFKGEEYALRRFPLRKRSWVQRILRKKSKYSFEIDPRDVSGAQALSDLRDQGIRTVAISLRQSTDHILSFFTALRTELAFYIGCLNLRELLLRKGEPTCIPVPSVCQSLALSARGLYDVSLTLKLERRVIGNDLAADGKGLLVITGANQGGKSTFLRSLGLAYLMTQAGMFAPAEELSLGVSTGTFTHYKREEDVTMKSGKLDEELGRMSDIVDHIRPGCVLLCNESFSSTNEGEGSEIGDEVIRALMNSGIRVFMVTHLFELARGFHRRNAGEALFLRAERKPDGTRTFRMVEGEPLSTSYGQDLYKQIFEVAEQTPTAPPLDVRT
ncbi:MAG: DNA mismatch repair protein MutS [Nitrososphaerota archaeon]|nr:DNA mismatch repair protein MutS [Nitrososphaerota archaeon]